MKLWVFLLSSIVIVKLIWLDLAMTRRFTGEVALQMHLLQTYLKIECMSAVNSMAYGAQEALIVMV